MVKLLTVHSWRARTHFLHWNTTHIVNQGQCLVEVSIEQLDHSTAHFVPRVQTLSFIQIYLFDLT